MNVLLVLASLLSLVMVLNRSEMNERARACFEQILTTRLIKNGQLIESNGERIRIGYSTTKNERNLQRRVVFFSSERSLTLEGKEFNLKSCLNSFHRLPKIDDEFN